MRKEHQTKCVVWDLDGTIWDGILPERDDVRLKPGIKEVIQTLDARGILHSLASKNNHSDAMNKLKEFGLDEYFLYPEICWNAKSVSIGNIRKNLNIDTNAIVFVDDDPLERDEVNSEHPDVLCIDASEYQRLPERSCLNPKFITEDSARRRLMYLADVKRKQVQNEFQGPKKEFLESLNMQLVISEAQEEDLKRAEELTIRTNQLNTTGKTYSYDELKGFISSKRHQLLICDMKDRYGACGKVGLALIELLEDVFHIRLFLMSCRVMSLGVGTVLLSYIMKETKKQGKTLKADFINTGKNRMMNITFTFTNFKKIQSNNSSDITFQNDLSVIQEFPPYIDVVIR